MQGSPSALRRSIRRPARAVAADRWRLVVALTLAACSQPTNGAMIPPAPPAGPQAPKLDALDDPDEHATADAVAWSGQRAIVVGSSGRTDARPVAGNPVFVDGAKYHGWLRAVDDRGAIAATHRFEGAREIHVRAMAAVGGDLVIAGESRAGSAREYTGWVARVGPEGEPRWRVDGLGPAGATGLSAVAVRGDGAVIAGGVRRSKGWLIAIDGHGKLAWDRDIALDEVTAIMAAGDGAVVAGIIGRTTTSAGTSRIVAIDATGQPRWTAEAAEHGHGELYAIAPLGDGGIAVGQAPGPTQRDGAWIVRFGGDGAIRSSQVLLGAAMESARAVAAAADGSLLVAGESLDPLAGRRGRVWRLDAAGKLVWQKTYGDRESLVRGIAAIPEGGAVVVGANQAIGATLRPWIFAIDAQGAPRWTAPP